MSSKRTPGISLALVSVFVLLGGSTPALAQTLDVHTDRGCGSQAVYQIGETTQFFFSSSQTVNARLTLTKPDGTILTLVDQQLIAGVTFTFSGRIALPNGTRTLTLIAGSASATCTYSLGTPTPPPGPQTARVLGALDISSMQATVTAPATVGVGQDFQVTIATTGDGCVDKGDEGVILADTGATIFVYDLTTATHPGVACPQIFKRLQHTVTLRFTQPGEKVIRAWGRQQGTGADPLGAPIVVERPVLVQ